VSSTSASAQSCRNCSNELAPGALVCDRCHALVHADELERLASDAKKLEAERQFRLARERWLAALKILPASSEQAEWVRRHSRELLETALAAEDPGSKGEWAKKLGPFGPIAVLLAKSKAVLAALFNLKFLLSFIAFLGFYWTAFGARFGIGFGLLILIHEMGHFIDVKRRGLPAEMPVFLPGLGAYVQWKAMGISEETRAAVSLAGPFAGWIASAICVLLWRATGDSLWAALARSGAWLNVLNLTPVWLLDGGQAISVLDKTGRLWILTACLIFWLVFGQGVFFVVAAGTVWRLLTKDFPNESSHITTMYYLGVLTSLAIVLRIVPGQGFGIR
jgi:Zn-dependent protease